MCEHVVYEAEMLRTTTELLNDPEFVAVDDLGLVVPRRTSRDICKYNAVFEASLIHLRALNDFLGEPNRGHNDDVFASDYLPSWSAQLRLSKKERAYINKRIAHVSSVRLQGQATWATARSGETLIEFGRFMVEFEAAFPARAQWFAGHLLPFIDE